MPEKEEPTPKSAEEKPESAEDAKTAPAAEKKKRSSKKASQKPMSNRKRKMQDARFEKNPKGRYVSIKKRANGKRNVQARAIRLGRKLLGFEGRMILLGKGAEGRALVDICRELRGALKDGKTDEQAEALFVVMADKLREGFKASSSDEKKDEKK
jgi:hypothetical protein